MSKALLLINRKSRQGQSGLVDEIALLKDHGFSLIELSNAQPADFPELIRIHAAEIDLVIIGGGDGTLNCAAEALYECQLPLGIVPLGTANDLARTLQIPDSTREACEVIAAGLSHKIDLGCVNSHYFFNVANIGLGVNVARQLSREKKAQWGVLSYVKSLIDAAKVTRTFRAEIICEEESTRVRTIQIAIGNGRFYGGGMTIADDAAIDDHSLVVYSFKAPESLWKRLTLFVALRKGSHGEHEAVYSNRGSQIEVRTRRALTVSADGEFITRTPARFHVIPDAITVCVPEHYLSRSA